MQKSLHRDPNECTGCLQCERTCARETSPQRHHREVAHRGVHVPPLKAFQDLTVVVYSSGLCLFTTFAWGPADIR